MRSEMASLWPPPKMVPSSPRAASFASSGEAYATRYLSTEAFFVLSALTVTGDGR